MEATTSRHVRNVETVAPSDAKNCTLPLRQLSAVGSQRTAVIDCAKAGIAHKRVQADQGCHFKNRFCEIDRDSRMLHGGLLVMFGFSEPIAMTLAL
jgi:hypothetical protein